MYLCLCLCLQAQLAKGATLGEMRNVTFPASRAGGKLPPEELAHAEGPPGGDEGEPYVETPALALTSDAAYWLLHGWRRGEAEAWKEEVEELEAEGVSSHARTLAASRPRLHSL